MPLHRLLECHVFSPEEIAVIGMAFEAALDKLGVVGRDDPATELVALKIVELAQQGVRDADELCERAVQFAAEMNLSQTCAHPPGRDARRTG